MARARNIKPGILKNELLGTADPLAYVLFTGLWMLADREGRLEDRPLRIKAEVFPYRPESDIDSLLAWLVGNGFIDRYESKGRKCISIRQFHEHQRPHPKEPLSELPANPRSTKGKPKVNPGSTQGEPGTRQDALLLNPSSLNPGSSDCLLPESLSTDRFRDVWHRWQQHRKEIHAPLKPSQAAGQLKKLAKEGEPAACERIERSIANGWRGLWFPSDDRANGKQDLRQQTIDNGNEFIKRTGGPQ